MKAPGDSIDWTGVQPDSSPIEPLNANSFLARLRRLSERAESLTTLRNAFAQQHFNGKQLSRNSEPASRRSR
jgi:hypothetical protein